MSQTYRCFLILLLFTQTVTATAQQQKQRLLHVEGGLLFTYPRYNPSGKYELKISDSVINKAKDTAMYSYGLNGSIRFSQNITKRLFWNAGIEITWYGMETKMPVRAVGIAQIDSTVYRYAAKLNTIEIPIGLTYMQEIKRSHIFAGVYLHNGFVYRSRFTTETIDYYSTKVEKTEVKKMEIENFYLGTSFSAGYSQFLSKRFALMLMYKLSWQMNQFSINDYFKVRFRGQMFHLGLTYKL